MKKLNKAMSVAVAAAMMVSLGACGNSADAAKDGTQSAGASGKVYASSWSIRHWIRQHRDLRMS